MHLKSLWYASCVQSRAHHPATRKDLLHGSDTSVGIFVVVNRVDGVWALLARGSGIRASGVRGSRWCREVGIRSFCPLV